MTEIQQVAKAVEPMTLDLKELGRVLQDSIHAIEADPGLFFTVTDEAVAAFASLLTG